MTMRWLLWLLVALVGFVLPALLFALVFYAQPARAHDIYKDLYSPAGRLCCGGDPVRGDCEALTAEQVQEMPDAFVFESRRYGRTVLVPKSKVQFLPVPGEVPGTIGHWCGTPRNQPAYIAPPDADQPDPANWTFCAFVNPGST